MKEKKWLLILCSAFILISCSNKSQNPLMGEWRMIEWDGETPVFDIYYKFDHNGEYTDSRSEGGIWNYEYYSPDSLILYHHGFYGERYKILKNSNDTLILQMKESVFYGEENGVEKEMTYVDEQPIFIFIRQ